MRLKTILWKGDLSFGNLSCLSPSFALALILVAVIICDQEYPVRPAFSLLSKLLDDFISKVQTSSYSNPSSISFPDIQNYLQKYQDPTQADTIMRVQQELDETKIVLVSVTFVSLALYLFRIARTLFIITT